MNPIERKNELKTRTREKKAKAAKNGQRWCWFGLRVVDVGGEELKWEDEKDGIGLDP